LAVSVPAAAAVDDNFDDNSMSNMWTLVEDDQTKLWVDETNQRLELRSAGPGSASNDALYLSNGTGGFQLKTSADFQITIDYSFTGFSGAGLIALDVGIGRDLPGTDSAAVAFARSDSHPAGFGSLVAAYRVNDVQTDIPIVLLTTDLSGQFIITYDSAADDLTLGLNDGNPAHMISFDNLVEGEWDADMVWVSFGGRGEGLTLASGDAYLDNLL